MAARATADRPGKRERERLSRAAGLLRAAERPVRVLRSVAWDPEVATRFFAADARELPGVEYPRVDATPVLEGVAAARRLIDGDSPVHAWLSRTADTIETGGRMLAALGTKAFSERSFELYGRPQDPADEGVGLTALELARRFDELISRYARHAVWRDEGRRHGAARVAETLGEFSTRWFPRDPPTVEIVDGIAAKAVAGGKRVRIRRDASFSEHDLRQLVHHELGVHVGTRRNGHEQHRLEILAAGHPGTTRTQEGLAVFAEFITGSMDPSRMLRLGDRVVAIEMALEGADFLELYRFFLERVRGDRGAAFENARRVVRGGLVTGGAPFAKDIVYLEGLLEVHEFLRTAVEHARVDAMRLLFAGKLAIEDTPALGLLARWELCTPPAFLPDWIKDPGFLVAYLAYVSFLSDLDAAPLRRRVRRIVDGIPELEGPWIAPPR